MQKYIYQHMGLGDHFVCNGLIRNIINPNDNYIMFVKPYCLETVMQMFSDIKNLQFLVGDDRFARTYINNLKLNNTNLILIGFQQPWLDESKSFEYNFYLQHNLPLHLKYDSFKCNRNYQKEIEIYNSYNIKEDYIFMHNDNRFVIDKNKLPKNIRIIEPIIGLTSNTLDYCTLIKNAKQVHTIESVFGFINELVVLNKEFIIHRYARPLSKIEIPEYRNVKEILV